jgi:hypothetical protein
MLGLTSGSSLVLHLVMEPTIFLLSTHSYALETSCVPEGEHGSLIDARNCQPPCELDAKCIQQKGKFVTANPKDGLRGESTTRYAL